MSEGTHAAFQRGIEAQSVLVMESLKVRHMLEYLESVGEHFNQKAFDEGFDFKVVFERLLRDTPESILEYREVEQ